MENSKTSNSGGACPFSTKVPSNDKGQLTDNDIGNWILKSSNSYSVENTPEWQAKRKQYKSSKNTKNLLLKNILRDTESFNNRKKKTVITNSKLNIQDRIEKVHNWKIFENSSDGEATSKNSPFNYSPLPDSPIVKIKDDEEENVEDDFNLEINLHNEKAEKMSKSSKSKKHKKRSKTSKSSKNSKSSKHSKNDTDSSDSNSAITLSSLSTISKISQNFDLDLLREQALQSLMKQQPKSTNKPKNPTTPPTSSDSKKSSKPFIPPPPTAKEVYKDDLELRICKLLIAKDELRQKQEDVSDHIIRNTSYYRETGFIWLKLARRNNRKAKFRIIQLIALVLRKLNEKKNLKPLVEVYCHLRLEFSRN